jgi:hypothetical protein
VLETEHSAEQTSTYLCLHSLRACHDVARHVVAGVIPEKSRPSFVESTPPKTRRSCATLVPHKIPTKDAIVSTACGVQRLRGIIKHNGAG